MGLAAGEWSLAHYAAILVPGEGAYGGFSNWLNQHVNLFPSQQALFACSLKKASFFNGLSHFVNISQLQEYCYHTLEDRLLAHEPRPALQFSCRHRQWSKAPHNGQLESKRGLTGPPLHH
jgi:hypothetical protein